MYEHVLLVMQGTGGSTPRAGLEREEDVEYTAGLGAIGVKGDEETRQ